MRKILFAFLLLAAGPALFVPGAGSARADVFPGAGGPPLLYPGAGCGDHCGAPPIRRGCGDDCGPRRHIRIEDDCERGGCGGGDGGGCGYERAGDGGPAVRAIKVLSSVGVNIRAGRTVYSPILCTAGFGDILPVRDCEEYHRQVWCKLRRGPGYVALQVGPTVLAEIVGRRWF